MTNRVLHELFGEIVLREPCHRQPRIVRPGVAAGLELLDLILNPDHVVRTTEDLSFAGALALRREFRVDVMLDRVSSHREAGASQLAALLSERTALDAGRAARLWTPLLHIPRPVVVPIDLYDSDGQLLPRPPQQEIRTLLEAALYHLLRESLYADPDFEREDSQLGRLLRKADRARWTLQSAVLAVCESSPARPDSQRRIDELLAAAGCTDPAQLDDERLAKVVEAEQDADKRLALGVLHDKVSGLPALLELVELIHGNYFIIAGLDPAHRDHSVRFSLPDVEASPGSPDRQLIHRIQQMLDPRDHNFTARIRLRVPAGVGQYRVQLTSSLDAEGESETSMAVVAELALQPRPAGRDLAAIRSCRDRLRHDLDRRPGCDRTTVNYEATEAEEALESLRALAGEQVSRANDMRVRWSGVSSRLFGWQARDLEDSAGALMGAVVAASACAVDLARLTSPLSVAVGGQDEPCAGPGDGDGDGDGDGQVRALAQALVDALDEVTAVAGDPLLDVHLTGDDAPGHDVGRIRVNRPVLRAAPHAEAKAMDVWVTMSDEALPYAASTLLPPVGLFAFLWLFGALVFESAFWMVSYSLADGMRAGVLDRPADALAAILLLIPGIAMTLVRMPKMSSVRARLRRVARTQVYTAVATLGVCATVIATRAGSDPTERLDLLLVLRVFRGAAWIFAAWIAWSVCAWALRGTFVWMPKGLSRAIAARRGDGPLSVGDRALRWLLGERKRADVEMVVADPDGVR